MISRLQLGSNVGGEVLFQEMVMAVVTGLVYSDTVLKETRFLKRK